MLLKNLIIIFPDLGVGVGVDECTLWLSQLNKKLINVCPGGRQAFCPGDVEWWSSRPPPEHKFPGLNTARV
jgi:hypothetical protein